ncbi:hypothetical protein [Kribbella sp. CA-293567]|uniref:hypothetical protein n=1 Tax=Kribbella sp. CA-293567 TaxID=3002436 RepID=UPI0022DD2490|nr:hypothetical protein [Kribbella sp. CA-293567]WBQ02991.1 hypothetical protein OX958_23775 [Kribbella sp. CA-293567]
MTTLQEIQARAAAASPGPWMWRGNVDHDDPALSRWMPGHGRVEVLRHYPRERTADDRGARAYAEYLRETDVWDDNHKDGVGGWRSYTEEEITEKVQHEWVEDQWGNPHREARLAFSDTENLLAMDARNLAIFEVCPAATTRDDRRVYRADIIGVRHPDAEFIAHSRQDVDDLLAVITAVETVCDHYDPMVARNDDIRFGADVVLKSIRAVLAGAQ